MIEILSPGIAASVQDTGRSGYRALGVGTAGAMDARALRIGNALLGNADDAAGIEFTLGAFEIVALADIDIALTGADVPATLDGAPVPRWWCLTVRKGQRLKAAHSPSGMRVYLAIGGGLDVPLVLGSRSTDLKCGFGGLEGRLLATGDRLGSRAPGSTENPFSFGLSPHALPQLWRTPASTKAIRFVPAREWDEHSPATRDAFTSHSWTVTTQSNRVGYRLAGPALEPIERHDMLSHPILPGTIQLLPSGQPVVHMVESNTAGGYPKLGVVIGPDLALIAQMPLGQSVRFMSCAIDMARAAAADEELMVARIRSLGLFARERGAVWVRRPNSTLADGRT